MLVSIIKNFPIEFVFVEAGYISSVSGERYFREVIIKRCMEYAAQSPKGK